MQHICFCGNSDLENYSEFYYKCPECNTLISKLDFSEELYKVKNENQDLYGKHYWQKEMLEMSGMKSLEEMVDLYLRERCAYWCENIIKFILPGSRIAEVGCGLGQLSYMLNALGYQAEGFELSEEICRYIETNLKVRMHHGELKDCEESFDAVLGFDLFEHLIEPREFLYECRRKVGEKGILCLQTPCYDPTLLFDEMMKSKPRFAEQLKEKQHVYLYSRDSIQKILHECGFPYVVFKTAYFGDDYDMFLFASASPIQECNDAEWNRRINSSACGRIVKAVISLEKKYKNAEKELVQSLKDSEERLHNVNILTKQIQTMEKDNVRLRSDVSVLGEQLKQSEQDSASRLQNMNLLAEELKVCREDSGKRLENMEKLSVCIEEYRQEKEKLEQDVRSLEEQLRRSRKDADDRLENMNLLTTQLKNCQKDSEDRLNNMNILDELLRDKTVQCEEKEKVIQQQNALIAKLRAEEQSKEN